MQCWGGTMFRAVFRGFSINLFMWTQICSYTTCDVLLNPYHQVTILCSSKTSNSRLSFLVVVSRSLLSASWHLCLLTKQWLQINLLSAFPAQSMKDVNTGRELQGRLQVPGTNLKFHVFSFIRVEWVKNDWGTTFALLISGNNGVLSN